MTKYRFTAVDKLKDMDSSGNEGGFIWVPNFIKNKRKVRPDISGYVEAVDEDEATQLAKAQIKRLWSHCKFNSIEEIR